MQRIPLEPARKTVTLMSYKPVPEPHGAIGRGTKTMAVAQLGGQRLYYEDTGGPGPVLVFSHGLLMDHEMFAPQIAALRGQYRCIAWDERGHGGTGQVPALSPFNYWDAADDLAALLGHLGVGRATLVGMAQGGYHSLRCALKYPGLVGALVLIDSQAAPEDGAQRVGSRALADFWLQHGPSEMLLDNAERVLLGEKWDGAAAWREKWWRCQPRHFLECLTTLGEREDLTDYLGEIRIPSMVIHGSADLAVPVSRARGLACGLGGEMVLVDGGGHAANLTHAATVNDAMAGFLSRLN